ncbi:hypothetical protein [Oryzihumus leptocrescens]|uniref:Uncharacterized protein n=1 Tax=Oryzihumus leptocrescens TaxID=297536 RepID=A0A542ZI99_9MICO|nr:hypothetical protein [Oryzihumus leptocrescens]TQL60083.1 hypothetical protein FB474_1460 [Oryzihumus leptocrescens]
MAKPTHPEAAGDLPQAMRRALAEAAALRLQLARCTRDRDDARTWAQACVHRCWPAYLDTTDPPDWLRSRPPRQAPARSPLPAALLRDELHASHEISELLVDLTRMVGEFDDARPAEMDAVFYVQAFNMLLTEVRALLTLLDTGLG